MLKSFIIVSILLTVTYNIFGFSEKTPGSRNILIFFSLDPGTPAYKEMLDGIRQNLSEEFEPSYNLYMEYLEIEQPLEMANIKEKFVIYNNKYRNIKLDLLICVGRNIIPVIKTYADSFFVTLPTISIDFDFSSYGYTNEINLNPHTAVLGLKMNIYKSLSLIYSIFPAVSSIVFISGSSPFDKFLLSVTIEVNNKFKKNVKPTFLTDLSMEEILSQVRTLPKNSIIIIPSFTTDSKLIPYYSTEASRLISRDANGPLFTFTDTGIGDGSMGGYILDFNKVGMFAGQAAVKIMNGTDPKSIVITEKDYYNYIFDWRELKEWNLTNSNLIPEESTILFKTTNPFDKFKWVIGIALAFLILQSYFIISLIRLNRKQRVMTAKIIAAENRHRELLREDRSLRLGQLTSSLSHELNQPLTGILSTAQAGINFINSNSADHELLKQVFQTIVSNTKRTASILSSIRGMMKLETREKEILNLNEIICETVEVYKSEASKFNITLNLVLPGEPVYVMADKVQIQQVLINFMQNAKQAMEKTDDMHKVIDVIQSVDKRDAVVSVRDYGKGIDESVKEKLFKPFITSKKDGTGIGLVICRAIIEDHHGKIWGRNLQECGAEFSFSLKCNG